MEAQGRSAQQEPTQNLGETLTVPFTPAQQSQLHLGSPLPHPLLLAPTEENLDRFLVHSIIHVAKHGAEISQYLRIFPADFTGFQLPSPSLSTPTPTHTPNCQTTCLCACLIQKYFLERIH